MTSAEQFLRAAGALVIMRSGCTYTVPPCPAANEWYAADLGWGWQYRFAAAERLLRQTDGYRMGAGMLNVRRSA